MAGGGIMEKMEKMEKNQTALFTDFYELTMAQGFWKKRMDNRAVFEMFFRKQPFNGGFSILAGIGTLLQKIARIGFTASDIDYLRTLGIFDEAFLAYLASFRFTGSVYAIDEGSVVFPQEPLVRIEGGLIECQIVEGVVLNTVNFQSLVATKAARVWLAAGKGQVMEFGLRRAQGADGALSASRAAYIGGASGTSNVQAGKEFGIKVMGTMAHSWVMAFPGEEAAFEAYAELYPDFPVFLIDTYDTLNSGIINAVKVGKRIAARGGNFGVRLDSGDIQYLTTEVRKILDDAGLRQAKITVSNDLDENIIATLVGSLAPVDSWGVGTRMVTGGDDAAFTGVYKLAAYDNGGGCLTPTMKFSDNPEKTTNPGVKQVWRITDAHGKALADVLSLDDPDDPAVSEAIVKGGVYRFWHLSSDYRNFSHTVAGNVEALLKKRMEKGKTIMPLPALQAIRVHAREELERFDGTYKRFLNPHVYKVSATEKLRNLKLSLIKNFSG
jgi:nicotinate phosphoribosyltransferase